MAAVRANPYSNNRRKGTPGRGFEVGRKANYSLKAAYYKKETTNRNARGIKEELKSENNVSSGVAKISVLHECYSYAHFF